MSRVPRTPKVAGEQRGRTFDDPVVVEQVEAFEQSVVGDLSLQLLRCPRSGLGCRVEAIGQRTAEGGR
jgi:hypothetical protein